MQKAIEAGFDPKSIVYAGVGKRDKELRYAIEQEIMAINCESIEELLVLDAMAAEAGRTVEVALRVNPDIDPKTNHCIDTGQADSKLAGWWDCRPLDEGRRGDAGDHPGLMRESGTTLVVGIPYKMCGQLVPGHPLSFLFQVFKVFLAKKSVKNAEADSERVKR